MQSPADIVFGLRRGGVRLWTENGNLHYQCADGLLTQAQLEELRVAKPALIRYLEALPAATDAQARIEGGGACTQATLSFAQQCLWHRWKLWRGSFRVPCIYTHVSGDLDVGALRAAVGDLLQRHPILSAKVIGKEDAPRQQVNPADAFHTETVDLGGACAAQRDRVLRRAAAELLTRHVEVSRGPLFEARILRLGAREHVLLAVVDHLVCDAASRHILLHDLWALYAQRAAHAPIWLPEVGAQFLDYVDWQHRSHAAWASRHGDYWESRLDGARRVRVFPVESGCAAMPLKIGVGAISLGDASLVTRLGVLSRQQRTTAAMIILSGYAAFLMRWCNTADVVIPFVTAGRLRPEIQSTVGCFACSVFLRVRLRDDDNFIDLLERVTREYASAQEHCDSGWMAARVPRRDFAANPEVNWVPADFALNSSNDIDHSPVDGMAGLRLRPCKVELSADDIASSSSAELVPWDDEPAVRFTEAPEGIDAALLYSCERVTARTVERFLHSLRAVVDIMLRSPNSRLRDVPLA